MSVAPEAVADIRSAISDAAWSADAFVTELLGAPLYRPFDERSVAFCGELSRELLRSSADAQMVTVAYWLRATSIARMREGFERNASTRMQLVPRGTAFHVTPANVDTVFVHSWILSLLAGNRNVVRLSSQGSVVRTRLLEAIATVMEAPAYAPLRPGNQLILTGHDDRVSRQLSEIADIRLIWGGDATVEHFRQFRLPVRGRDVSFPNRHSLAILDAEAVGDISEKDLALLADRFFNDAYWFDQGACSSPRLIIWATSAGAESAAEARTRFHSAVGEAIRRHGYQAQTGIAIKKMALALLRAAATDGVRIESGSNEATWVTIPDLRVYERDNCGGGLFFEYESRDLATDLAKVVGPIDQTAACFGLDLGRVTELASALNGRGIDRWVRVGHALEFGSTWDGYDLLLELTRRVTIDL